MQTTTHKANPKQVVSNGALSESEERALAFLLPYLAGACQRGDTDPARAAVDYLRAMPLLPDLGVDFGIETPTIEQPTQSRS